jgi:hypothetical protein
LKLSDDLKKVIDALEPEEARAANNLLTNLDRQRWRLDNLYTIVDAAGKEIPFKMNYAQKLLYLGIWFCNLILKSRQHGITTFMCLLFLDICLFNSNTHACIIAHNREDAEDFFQKKVKFAYDNLPELLKKAIPAKLSSSKSLTFENGSSIRVTTSGRSGTYQLVHISEFGKMCAKFPMKAEEVITGTLNAIHPGQLVTIESTAEGREGRFYEMCKQSRALSDILEGRMTKDEIAAADMTMRQYLDTVDEDFIKLSKTQYKFFFFGWFDNLLNQVDPVGVPIPERMQTYFDQIEASENIHLTPEQKAWYVTKEAVQGDFMFREHPSTADEAFMASVEGTYYAVQMAAARKGNRITKVPHQDGVLCDTWWDLGFNDENAIWVTQTVGREIHVLRYYQNSGEGMMHYADKLQEWSDEFGYRYGRWVAPFDIDNHEYTSGKTRRTIAFEAGINFEVAPKLDKPSQIANVRRILSICWFDIEGCERGLAALDAYRKEWNEKLAVYRDRPLHDWASNGADAFAVMASAHQFHWDWSTASNNLTLSEEARGRESLLQKSPKGWT